MIDLVSAKMREEDDLNKRQVLQESVYKMSRRDDKAVKFNEKRNRNDPIQFC